MFFSDEPDLMLDRSTLSPGETVESHTSSEAKQGREESHEHFLPLSASCTARNYHWQAFEASFKTDKTGNTEYARNFQVK